MAGDWLANSSKAIKRDIKDIESPLSLIDQLRPVRFRYTDDYRDAHASVGDFDYFNYIAEEFRTVFPDFVRESADGLLQVDTHPASIVAVAAIQELHQVVQAKDAEIVSLREQVAAQDKRLAALEEGAGIRPAPAASAVREASGGSALPVAWLLAGAALSAGLVLTARGWRTSRSKA